MKAAVLTALVALLLPCLAEVTSAATVVGGGGTGSSAISKLLQDGYDIKTAFYDNSGGAYIILQKATSAYMCHSTTSQTCEKLN